jgi:hypothetical protein
MNWNTKPRHAPATPRRARNPRVERLSRQIRDLCGFLRTGAQTISEIVERQVSDEAPITTPAPDIEAKAASTGDPAATIQLLIAQTELSRAGFTNLRYSGTQLGQAYAELLEAVAERLEALVTPARYRR